VAQVISIFDWPSICLKHLTPLLLEDGMRGPNQVLNRTCSPLRFYASLCVGVLAVAACSPGRTVPRATIIPFPGTPTAQCLQEEIWPKIEEIRPTMLKPGTEVPVSASGGYLRDQCGGYDEGARTYQIYFDDEPVADLSCYVNHCEGKFTLPEGVAAGPHCMGVQKGTCQLEVQVAGK
jgi:hypothetical protein